MKTSNYNKNYGNANCVSYLASSLNSEHNDELYRHDSRAEQFNARPKQCNTKTNGDIKIIINDNKLEESAKNYVTYV